MLRHILHPLFVRTHPIRACRHHHLLAPAPLWPGEALPCRVEVACRPARQRIQLLSRCCMHAHVLGRARQLPLRSCSFPHRRCCRLPATQDKPGKKVGVVGLGGLGHMAVKLAKAFGCEVGVALCVPGMGYWCRWCGGAAWRIKGVGSAGQPLMCGPWRPRP